MRLSSVRRWCRQTVTKMAAHNEVPTREPSPHDGSKFTNMWRKVFGKDHHPAPPPPPTTLPAQPASPPPSPPSSPAAAAALIRRVSRKVVPGLPRAKTFKRQQSEDRNRLEPVETTQEERVAERRAVSMDRRPQHRHFDRSISPKSQPLPGASAPDFITTVHSPVQSNTNVFPGHLPSAPPSPAYEEPTSQLDEGAPTISHDLPGDDEVPSLHLSAAPSTADAQSMTTSVYDNLIRCELESKWILNLSMHFRDKSKREKFFVTYHEENDIWRRVTVSLDYRNAPDDSLEKDLSMTRYQRDKSAKIYEAIRESLQDIQFYDTVTNLKLQTTDGRLHVHVVEDVNEIIHYPSLQNIRHLHCRQVHERDLGFDSHLSGFVYKVRHGDKVLIKKEIPGPDTVDEFLYEVNALSTLRFSPNIIGFYGVVVDDAGYVKGLLIDYAEQGALVDVIYEATEACSTIDWPLRERWARQIVQGLSDVHEAGFVQGDFTLSNIVIDDKQNARIIDINRRGCPVGWEPPEATPLIDCNQRISMYIGVKSDLFQLGMVLWALATMEDEPEARRRPLRIDNDIDVPGWYRTIVNICLHENPRARLQAIELLKQFPEEAKIISVEDGVDVMSYQVEDFDDGEHPRILTVDRPYTWSANPYTSYDYPASPAFSEEPDYPPRGRSPPRPLPNKSGNFEAPYLPRPFIGSAESEEEHSDDEDETPQETPTMEKITQQLERDLNNLRVKSSNESGIEPTQTTGGDSQKEEDITLNAEHSSFPENDEAQPAANEKPASKPNSNSNVETAEHEQPPLERPSDSEHETQAWLQSLPDNPPLNSDTGAQEEDAAAEGNAPGAADDDLLSKHDDFDSGNYVWKTNRSERPSMQDGIERVSDVDIPLYRPQRDHKPNLQWIGAFHGENPPVRKATLSDDDLEDEEGSTTGSRGDEAMGGAPLSHRASQLRMSL